MHVQHRHLCLFKFHFSKCNGDLNLAKFLILEKIMKAEFNEMKNLIPSLGQLRIGQLLRAPLRRQYLTPQRFPQCGVRQAEPHNVFDFRENNEGGIQRNEESHTFWEDAFNYMIGTESGKVLMSALGKRISIEVGSNINGYDTRDKVLFLRFSDDMIQSGLCLTY